MSKYLVKIILEFNMFLGAIRANFSIYDRDHPVIWLLWQLMMRWLTSPDHSVGADGRHGEAGESGHDTAQSDDHDA